MPDAIEAFLLRPNPAVIACVRPDGFPMTVATWYDWQDGRIVVNMKDTRSRLRWMRLNPKVSVTVFSGDWYSHVSLYGSVVRLEDDSDLTGIDHMARRYTGRSFGARSDRRVTAWIEPHGYHIWDPSGELG